jgi:hypothetical protein
MYKVRWESALKFLSLYFLISGCFILRIQQKQGHEVRVL